MTAAALFTRFARERRRFHAALAERRAAGDDRQYAWQSSIDHAHDFLDSWAPDLGDQEYEEFWALVREHFLPRLKRRAVK